MSERADTCISVCSLQREEKAENGGSPCTSSVNTCLNLLKYVCAHAHTSEDTTCKSQFSLHLVGLRNPTQVFMLVSRQPDLRGPPIGPVYAFRGWDLVELVCVSNLHLTTMHSHGVGTVYFNKYIQCTMIRSRQLTNSTH